MTELSEQERRKRRRAGWAWGCGGAFALVALVVGALVGYLAYANQIPTVTPAVLALPNPNARDDCLAAVALMPPDSRQAMTDLQEGKDVDLKPIVKAAQPALTKVRNSFRHQYLNPPVNSYNTAFPELADFRNIARLFALEGRLAEQEGRYNDAVRSYLDCYHFGGEVQHGGVLINGLVGIAIQAIALAPLDELATKLDEATATRTARELAVLEDASPTASDCLAVEEQFGELAMVEVMKQAHGSFRSLQQAAGGGPPEWSWESIHWGARYALTPKKQMLDAYRRHMARYVAESRKPYGHRAPDPDPPDDPLNSLLLPAFNSSIFSWDRNRANCRLVQGKLAARAYFLRHGRMPAKMTDVAPEIFPKVPLDWFGGKPLLIGPVGDKGPAVVYSAGPDMDDDRGRAVSAQMYENSDGDLVEVRRRRPKTPPAAARPARLGRSTPPSGPPGQLK